MSLLPGLSTLDDHPDQAPEEAERYAENFLLDMN